MKIQKVPIKQLGPITRPPIILWVGSFLHFILFKTKTKTWKIWKFELKACPDWGWLAVPSVFFSPKTNHWIIAHWLPDIRLHHSLTSSSSSSSSPTLSSSSSLFLSIVRVPICLEPPNPFSLGIQRESSRTSRGVPVITHFRFVNVDVLLHVLVVMEGNNCYEHCIDVWLIALEC